MRRLEFTLLTFVALGLPVAAAAQANVIGIIDFYGLRQITAQSVRDSLGLVEGDTVPRSWSAIEKRIESLPGVAEANVSAVCCEGGRTLVYVGIREDGAPAEFRFLKTPRGKARLPKDVVEAGAAFKDALGAAVRRGVAGEEHSQGYALMEDSAARAIQLRFVEFAARDAKRLRDVLRTSRDAGQRALAAEVLGYSADRRGAAEDLALGARDPSAEVRNNAVRALMIFAEYAQQHPDARIEIPSSTFIELLASPTWTDRNKASMALMQLTASRDPKLLVELRERALQPLIDIARWKSAGHDVPGYVLLGRIGGLSEDAIREAWQRQDVNAVIGPATKVSSASR